MITRRSFIGGIAAAGGLSAGNALGEAVATPYCPERFLTLVSIKDGEGREFQIGTGAIDICAKLPPNTGSGLSIGRGRLFFDEGSGRPLFEFREDALSSMRWESEPFEIDGEFRPCDISLNCWTVPDADGGTRCFIDCNSFEYRHCPLKMNVVDHGYKAVDGKVWKAVHGK